MVSQSPGPELWLVGTRSTRTVTRPGVSPSVRTQWKHCKTFYRFYLWTCDITSFTCWVKTTWRNQLELPQTDLHNLLLTSRVLQLNIPLFSKTFHMFHTFNLEAGLITAEQSLHWLSELVWCCCGFGSSGPVPVWAFSRIQNLLMT